MDTVPDPEIREPTDTIIKITSTAICGSDLHLYDGFMMGMEKGACPATSRWEIEPGDTVAVWGCGPVA